MVKTGVTVGSIFAIAFGVYFLSALLPGALANFFGANTTGWDSATIALWAIIPLAIIGVVVWAYMPKTGGGA